MDDFVLFGDDRYESKRLGERVQQKLGELKLVMHPNNYRILLNRLGLDFVRYVVFEDSRIRVRSSTARRFQRRYRKMQWELGRSLRLPAEVTQSVGHLYMACQSLGLHRRLLSSQNGEDVGNRAGLVRLLVDCVAVVGTTTLTTCLRRTGTATTRRTKTTT